MNNVETGLMMFYIAGGVLAFGILVWVIIVEKKRK